MSTRKPPHPGDVYAQSSENIAQLRAQYPAQFEGPFISLSWPDGWHRLVSEVCAYAQVHDPDVRWDQIKEKYGGLRMYYIHRTRPPATSGTEQVRIAGNLALTSLASVVDAAVKASEETCCLCGGASGQTGVAHDFGGWWLTACPPCIPKIEAYRALPWDQRSRP